MHTKKGGNCLKRLMYLWNIQFISHLDHTFTYCADGYTLTRGMRVQVPFGSKTIVGFVEKVEDISDDGEFMSFSLHSKAYHLHKLISFLC